MFWSSQKLNPINFTFSLGYFWIGIKKYDATLTCSTDPKSNSPICAENITYWTDSNSTARSTSQFRLTTRFNGKSSCVMSDRINTLDDGWDCSAAHFFLCQKRCRMSGNDII